jgi:hypothetical protein
VYLPRVVGALASWVHSCVCFSWHFFVCDVYLRDSPFNPSVVFFG